MKPTSVPGNLVWHVGINLAAKSDSLFIGGWPDFQSCQCDGLGYCQRRKIDIQYACLYAGEINEVIDNPQEVFAALFDCPGKRFLLVIERGVGEELGTTKHPVERGAQLMANNAEEFVFRARYSQLRPQEPCGGVADFFDDRSLFPLLQSDLACQQLVLREDRALLLRESTPEHAQVCLVVESE